MRARGLLAAIALFGLTALPANAEIAPAVQSVLDSAKVAIASNDPDRGVLLDKADRAVRAMPATHDRIAAQATVQWLRAESLLREGQPERAAPLLGAGLKVASALGDVTKVRADLLGSQGTLFLRQGKAVEALRNYQESYRLFVALKEPRSQAIALQNIASLYSSANDWQRAATYYRQASEAYRDDPLLSLSLHNNRGNVLLSLSRYRDAAAELELALGFARKLGKPQLEARVIVNLVRVRVEMKDFAAADTLIARGFALAKGGETRLLRRQLLASAAGLAVNRGDYTLAERFIREAFDDMDLKASTPEFRNAHVYAHEIFTHVGNASAALAHLEALKRIDDQTAKVATTTGAALMAANFDFQGEQLRTAEQRAKAQQFLKLLFGAIGIAALLLAAALGWGLVVTRRSRNKVAAANIELGETNVALEKALQAKTEFLATTSHEIRTPLNGILGMTQVMLADPRVDAQMRDRIGIVHGAGVTMRALVDDILDVAKMETGNLTVDAAPMDLCAVLTDVTRLWDEQARAKGLGFRLDLADAPRWIVSDAGRLRQIVFNLLSNAIKFTASGEVALRVAAADGRLTMAVSDSGIGIPEAKFEEIFESFRQVDAGTTRQFGGTGLGLTICRNLAEALGGSIAVASVEGQGSMFTVDLPLELAEAPETVVEAGPGGAMLIVDRNPIARAMLRTIFTPRVGSLRFATSPEEALMMLGEAPATHLLVDEATLKAGADAPLETLRTLVAAVGTGESAILWAKGDEATYSQLSATGVGKVIEKPIAGPALAAAIFPAFAGEMSATSDAPLVSRAA